MKLKKKNKQKIEVSSKNRTLDLPYYFFKNGRKVSPEKLQREKNKISCSLGKDKIEDTIKSQKNSLEIERKWRIKGDGKVKLSFQTQIPENPRLWINPCVNYNGNPKGDGKFPKPKIEEGWSFREDRISIPSCTIIKDDKGPLAVFTSPAEKEKEISSIQTTLEDFGVSLTSLIPFTERPKRHTNKWYLGDLSGKKEKYFKIVDGFDYERKFYILWEDNPEASYHSLLKRIWRKLSPDWRTYSDWGRVSELKINHLLNNLYLEKGDASGFITSMHWSMMPINNTLSGGFVGKNPEICLSLYRAYLDCEEELLRNTCFKVLDFFTEAQLSNGLLLSDYQLAKRKWYGLHFLKKDECSTRMMSEIAYNFIRMYKIAKNQDDSKEKWLEIGKDFCDFMVKNQPEDGNFGKWWSRKGELIDSSGTNGAYVIWPLVELYRMKNSNRYLEAAEKATRFHIENSVEKDLYWGDALDSNCIDKEGGHSILKALLLLHDVTEDDYYLEYAKKAGNYVLSWTYFYDVPFSEETPLGERDVTTVGGTSVSTAHHHLDPYGATVAYEWLKLWRKTGDEIWKEYGLAALDFVHQLIATEEDPLGLPEYFEGWQPEQLDQTEWDYISNFIWGRGTFKSIIAWVPALTLGALFDIRKDFPEILDFEIKKINKRDSRELNLSKGLRKFGTWTNYFV